MVYEGIANYLEKSWGVTEFWINKRRVVKTVEGKWLSLK